MKKRQEFYDGIKTGSPIAIGYIPIAIAFGALAIEAEMSVKESLAMSVFVFAGASQFVAAGMILTNASAIQITITTLFVNLRHLIMSMVVNEKYNHFPLSSKIGLSFGITDETFALLTLKSEGEEREITPLFAAGLMSIAYLGWVSGTALGSLSAQIIPSQISAGMTMGLYAMFIGLLVPHIRQSIKIGIITILSMMLNTIFQTFLESGWAIILAIIIGAFLGTFIAKEK